jgi:spore coat polysaccharide biosynthesis protein SpsF (cytidylyltransferase family)
MENYMLPNFIIVGAAKCGTTSLNEYLKQHPEVYMAPLKEPYFFSFMNEQPTFTGPYDYTLDKQLITDFEVYKSLFDGVSKEKAIGECSNSYLFFENTPQRIKQYIPDGKIIIVLRNPIERTYSHYRQHVMLGHENLSFEEALQKEEERKQLGWRWHYQYTAQSMYYEQVKRYYEIFDRNKIWIGFFENLKENPAAFMKDIFNFLEVNPDISNIKFERHNPSGIPKNKGLLEFATQPHWIKEITRPFTPRKLRAKISKILYNKSIDFNHVPKMKKETKEYLKNIFREDVKQLEKLIGRDLSLWNIE